MNRTRRSTLLLGLRTLLAMGGGLALSCSRSESRCYDPETLSTPERSLRDTQRYTDRSTTRGPDETLRQCAGCQFFDADASATGCGRCQILGGTVSATGHCDAWAARQTG